LRVWVVPLTKQCNTLLQRILDFKRISLKPDAYDAVSYSTDSNKLLFVHLLHQILWEDKEREIVAPEFNKKDPNLNKSDSEIARELIDAWLKKEGLMKDTAT
jgi:hypothetical protein